VVALEPIDLVHLGRERTIASYLVDTDDGPALFDCGPATTVAALKAGLDRYGLQLTDVRHLLLSHIHLDHAGAAGVLVREHPGLQVHVSGIGAPHLVDPSRLERSARRLYGDTFDTLWGELAPVPEPNVHVVGEHVLGLECFPTPGHASHHVCYLDRDGTLYAGDAAGVRIAPAKTGAPSAPSWLEATPAKPPSPGRKTGTPSASPGRFVLPPTPPPEFDLDAWQATLEQLEERAPERLALIHWGVFDDVQRHLADLRLELYEWADFVRGGAELEEFAEYVKLELRDAGEDLGHYDLAMPLWQSYQGLKQWAERRQR
jgi:glyoxylase-like metal-dependent hydrolase (beta-lactamase superfamily II)